MPTNVYGNISPRTAGFAVKKMLEVGVHMMPLQRFGQVDPQPKNSTKVRKYRRFNPLPRATAPLAEGVTPPGETVTYEDVTCTLEQYGDMVKITDVIQDTSEDPVLQEMTKRCGEQAAETVEVVRYNILKAGTNVFYGNSAASRTVLASGPRRGDLREIYRGLKRNKGREISQIIGATPNVSTQPIGSAYFGLCSTDLDADLRNVSGFTPVEQYSSTGSVIEGEIGKIENIRFVCSALFEPWLAGGASGSTFLTGGTSGTGSADVYPILIVARDAYAIVPLQGEKSITPTVLNPGTPDKSDPLGQVGYISWKTYQTCAILQQLWLVRYEVCCTAHPA